MNRLAPLLLTAAALAGLSGQSRAVVLPPEATRALEQQAAGFTDAPGFVKAEIGQSCNDEAFYTPQRFPRQGQTAFRPDAQLDAVTKAVLRVDCAEGPLPHARYLIRFHQARVPQANDVLRAYVEVQRFNLGPLRYQDVIQYADQEFWPPQSIFGVGPHVAWRFVFGPVQGTAAHIEQASRAELNQADAARQDCLGILCLSSSGPAGLSGSWQVFTPAAPAGAVFREPDDADLPGPARVTQLMFLNATGGTGQAELSESASIGQPEMVFLISKNVSGQDSSISGLLHQQGLMDDAIAEMWTQLRLMPQSRPQWLRKAVHRAGRP